MKARHLGRLAAAGALCSALAGCFGPNGAWQIPSFMRPPPPPAPAPHRYEPAPRGETINNPPGAAIEAPAKNVHPWHPPEPAEPAAVTTPAPHVEPIPKPTVTLGDGPSKEHAQQLLDETGAKLAKVNRGTLGADSATIYDQASNFLQAGRRAATEEDYVAASGFAQKAAVLAAKLVPASP